MGQVRRHYNGYHFSFPGNSESVYNPFTLACCLRDMQDHRNIRQWAITGWPNHWANSGTPIFLIRLMKQGQYPLPADPPPWDSLMGTPYSLDSVDFTPLMFQTGYYTLRQATDGDLYLDYPNDEVRRTYSHELLRTYRQPPDPRTLQAMHRALADEDYARFCELLHTFLAGVPSEKLRRETDCHLVLHVLCQLMQVDFSRKCTRGVAAPTWRSDSPNTSASWSSSTASPRRRPWTRFGPTTTVAGTSGGPARWWRWA